MAQRNTATKLTPKQQALKDLEEARSLLGVHVHLASAEWSPRELLRQAVQKHLWVWVSASGVGGLFLWQMLMPSRRTKIGRDISDSSAKKSGLIALLMSPMLGMARQTALKYGTSFLQSYLQNHLSRHEGSPTPVREPNSHV
jgi:hypothetical protein